MLHGGDGGGYVYMYYIDPSLCTYMHTHQHRLWQIPSFYIFSVWLSRDNHVQFGVQMVIPQIFTSLERLSTLACLWP